MRRFDPLGSNLIFLISLPRSGSTLLQRVLGGHPDVTTVAEPWLMLHPLYALKTSGLQTDYDANLARQALADFLDQVEGGEEAYIDGIRRFTGDLYENVMRQQGGRLFLDKTPRYYRVIPELRRVFPNAKFVFLLRNPLAVLSSTLNTWFGGEVGQLRDTTNHKDLLEGPQLLLQGIASLGDQAIVVRYEELVDAPGETVENLCGRIGITFDPGILDYGDKAALAGKFGDQVGIVRHIRPSRLSRDKWMGQFSEEHLRAFAFEYLDALGSKTLAALGYDDLELRKQLESGYGCEPDTTAWLSADQLNAEGEALYSAGDMVGAQRKFEAARSVDPSFATSYNNLLVLHWQLGDAQQALQCLADGLSHAPEDRNLIINGAEILSALGQPAEAAAICRRYLSTHPDDGEVAALLMDEGGRAMSSSDTDGRSEPTIASDLASGCVLPNDVITIGTSIAPKDIGKQRRAVDSWLRLGFRVVSLNTADEIRQIESKFPDVEFFRATRDGKSIAGKPFVFVDDLIECLCKQTDSHICGIVNSDIILRAPQEIVDYLSHEARGALVFGSRVDVTGPDESQGKWYQRGFDYFFFDRNVINRLPKTNFMLGVPWWDYWVPIGLQLQGVPIKRLDSRIALHVWHAANYSQELLKKFALEFVRHCSSASFSGVFDQCSRDRSLQRGSYSILSDLALDHIGRNAGLKQFPGSEPATRTPDRAGASPRVTALVSTYDSEAFIGECLSDLASQTIAEQIEVIVIDAASPGDENRIVEEFQQRFSSLSIRYHRTASRIGVYAAWNLAARMARGEYLISCSTNDRLRHDAIEILMRTLDENPDVALVYGNSLMTKSPHQRFDQAELCSVYLWPEFNHEQLLDHCLVGPHPMWRRELHETVGYFDESFVALGDQDFWLRVAEHHLLKSIPDFTGLYYVSENSLTGNTDVAQRETDLVHLHYQWRARYPKWYELSAARRLPGPVEDCDYPLLQIIVVAPPGGLATLSGTLDDLGEQNYPNLIVTILADQPAPDPDVVAEGGLNWGDYQEIEEIPELVSQAVEAVESEWVAIIDGGDRLVPGALRDMALYSQAQPDWVMMYVDDDEIDSDGRLDNPRFKPHFNLAMLRSLPYAGNFFWVRRGAFQGVQGISHCAAWRGSELALKIADRFGATTVGHVERLLHHRAAVNRECWGPRNGPGYRDAVSAHLERRKIEAEIVSGLTEETLFVQHNCSCWPHVTLIVSGDGSIQERQFALQSLLTKTAYPNFDVVSVSLEEGSKMDLSGMPDTHEIRSVTPTASESMADALNRAAESARGDFIILLDGRCVAIQPDWLDRLVQQASEADVAAVGARVIDKRKAVIDTGITLGIGAKGIGSRANIGLHMQSGGYMGRALVAQDVSAVTTLCALIRRDAYVEAGGVSRHLTTGLYRDIDLAAKLRLQGRRIVWTPASTIMFLGMESHADRPPVDKSTLEREIRHMESAWAGQLLADPAFNRNLNHARTDFQIETNTVPSWDPVIDTLPRVIGFGAGSLGSWQYRARQPLEALNANGQAQCVLAPFSEKKQVILPTIGDLAAMKPDTLLMHNTLHDNFMTAMEQYKKLEDVFIVFGQDDLMFALPPSNPFSKTIYKDVKKRIRRALELADRVVVTTQPLAGALAEMHGDVRIIPNFLRKDIWGNMTSLRRQSEKPRIGWAGAQQHGGDLAMIAEVVRQTSNEVDWVFFGMCPESIRPYVKEFHRAVRFDCYPEKLASLNLDLAIAPLERNRFNEAKSNLRILEYGALGWPVIASDVFPYQESPVCTVPNNVSAWVKAIRERVGDLDAAEREGDRLKSWVEANWMLDDHLDHWTEVLRAESAPVADTVAPRARNAIS